ncbi:MAG: FAD-dependent oxidoreductase, partial [Gemmata sp.]
MGEAVTPRVAIIGAGPAGLTAAQHLLAHPSAPGVVLIDKGRHAGGRLCTRTLNLPDGTRARFDLGPQVLYARPFGNRPAEHRLVALANRQTDERLHEHRIVGRIGGPDEEAVVDVGGLSLIGGMREWAFRQVTAHRGRIELHDHTLAEKLERTGDGWRVHTRSLRDDLCTTVSANALIVTPPLPQALALLAGNGVALPDELRDALRAVHYTRCVALYGMFAGNGPLQPGGVWFRDGPLEWVTDNARKGVSEVGPAVTALSSNEWAKANWHEPDGRLIELLLPRLHPWVGDPLDPAQV